MLISVSQLEYYTGVCGDPLAESYIKSAQEIISSYLGYDPEENLIVSDIDGTGERFIILSGRHVHDINNFKIGEIEINENDFSVKNNFIYLKKNIFPVGFENIHIEYKVGWNNNEMPEVIKTTALQIASLRQVESGQNIGVNSKSFGDSGQRVFLSTRKYNDFLFNISQYKVI